MRRYSRTRGEWKGWRERRTRERKRIRYQQIANVHCGYTVWPSHPRACLAERCLSSDGPFTKNQVAISPVSAHPPQTQSPIGFSPYLPRAPLTKFPCLSCAIAGFRPSLCPGCPIIMLSDISDFHSAFSPKEVELLLGACLCDRALPVSLIAWLQGQRQRAGNGRRTILIVAVACFFESYALPCRPAGLLQAWQAAHPCPSQSCLLVSTPRPTKYRFHPVGFTFYKEPLDEPSCRP
jgi:hypothetical protein